MRWEWHIEPEFPCWHVLSLSRTLEIKLSTESQSNKELFCLLLFALGTNEVDRVFLSICNSQFTISSIHVFDSHLHVLIMLSCWHHDLITYHFHLLCIIIKIADFKFWHACICKFYWLVLLPTAVILISSYTSLWNSVGNKCNIGWNLLNLEKLSTISVYVNK